MEHLPAYLVGRRSLLTPMGSKSSSSEADVAGTLVLGEEKAGGKGEEHGEVVDEDRWGML